MATAREALYEEFVVLTAAPPGGDAQEIIRKIMTKYRVQTKPGVTTKEGLTARDDLGDRLLEIWSRNAPEMKAEIGTEIDKFRMQSKTKPSGSQSKTKPSGAKKARPAGRMTAPAPVVAEKPAAGPAMSRAPRSVPVAGGPRPRGKKRSECPKCHSMGVVLARSYAGDEYYSCIYCGWQAFKPADENDPTASLAGRLLGQTPKS